MKNLNPYNEHKHRIKHKLLYTIMEKGLRKEFANFLYYKSFYSNSCIYNWNYSKIARIVNQSRFKVKEKIDLFLKRGWCRKHYGNIVFNSPEVLNYIETGQDYKCLKNGFTKIIFADTEAKILRELEYLALRLKIQQCKYKHKIAEFDKVGHKYPQRHRKKQLKAIKEDKNIICGRTGYQVLSHNKLSKIWGVVNPKPIIKKLYWENYISIEKPKLEYLGPFFEKDEDILEKSNIFVHKGKLFRRKCNMYKPNLYDRMVNIKFILNTVKG